MAAGHECIRSMRGVNRGMQIRRSVPCFRQNFCSNHNHIRKQRCKGSKVNWYMWMALLILPKYIVKRVTCLMTTTQYNSNNSVTPEFKWTSFEKGNNLDELSNILTKAEEWSMIQIFSFRPQKPNIRQAQSGIRAKNYTVSWSTTHCVFKISQSAWCTAKIHNLYDFKDQIRQSENLFTPHTITVVTKHQPIWSKIKSNVFFLTHIFLLIRSDTNRRGDFVIPFRGLKSDLLFLRVFRLKTLTVEAFVVTF